MMRITNAMMTSNTKNNININKLNEDKLNTQIATGQVISRPSDDPVVAIRALRLNTNLSQLNQYYKKNIPDAQAWLNVTETALKQTDQIFTNIRENLTAGASDQHTATDRQKILESLKGLRAELYSSGNADYAERTVFTDYRTQKSLTFLSTDTDLNENYQIHETFGKDSVETMRYITTYTTDGTDPSELNVKDAEIYRIRLAYDDNDSSSNIIGDKITLPDGSTISVTEESIARMKQYEIDKVYTKLYPATGEQPDGAIYIPETGELILSKKAKEAYEKAFDNTAGKVALDKITVGDRQFNVVPGDSTSTPAADQIIYDFASDELILGSDIKAIFEDTSHSPTEITMPDGKTYKKGSGDGEINYSSGKLTLGDNVKGAFSVSDKAGIEYNKNRWESGDLRPEHYFACVQTVDGKNTYYNYAQKTDGSPDPDIPAFKNRNMEVEISFNQKITINTHANEVYTHDIGRDIDELISITQAVVDADEHVSELEKKLAAAAEADKPDIQKEIDAAKKEYSLKKDNMQKMFSAALDNFTGYADRNNLAISNIGSMQSRLSITKERVADQLQSFKELADANINAELTETSIDFSSAKLALEAAQLAAGKIAQQTLLNYL